MRLFLLPISTRQSLIYCQRLNQHLSQRKPNFFDKTSNKATTTWLGWEKKETGWQKTITIYGNKLFQRLPYAEYGLKTIPPLKERRRNEEIVGDVEVPIEFPAGWIEESRVMQSLRDLGSPEKQAFHRKWLIGSVVGMPLVAPFGLVPVLPNLPFFYLCFRAWSHWRARSGSEHLGFLLEKNLFKISPSKRLHFAYEEAAMDRSLKQTKLEVESIKSDRQNADEKPGTTEHMLLSPSSGAIIASHLDIPELQMEIDRAVWQVERAINARQNPQGVAGNNQLKQE